MPKKLISLVIYFFAGLPAVLAPGCWCAPMEDHDDDWGDDEVNVACSCTGLAEAVYSECNGAIEADQEPVSQTEFALQCQSALDAGGLQADLYHCYVEAACASDNCDETAKRIDLCNL